MALKFPLELVLCILIAVIVTAPSSISAVRRRHKNGGQQQQQEAAVADTSNNNGDTNSEVDITVSNDQPVGGALDDRALLPNSNNNGPSPPPSQSDTSNLADQQQQQQQQPQTQDQVKPTRNRQVVSDSNINNIETILDLDFARDFSHFNPRDDASVFHWSTVEISRNDDNNKARKPDLDSVAGIQEADSNDDTTNGEGRLKLVADNAAFLRSDDGILSMSSTPFDRWLPQSAGINASQAYFDAAAVIKQTVKVGKNQILRVMLKFRCETFNTAQQKFGPKAVTDALDDPRLAACGLFLIDNDITGIELGILLTNKGIWAVYNNQEWFRAVINGNYRAYNIYRRLAARTNVDDLVEARIEVDRARKETRYYVNNKLMWRVHGGWGAPSIALLEEEQTRLVSMSDGQLLPVMPKSYSIYVANSHKMDVADPNNVHVLGDENRALVKYVNVKDYYGTNLLFWDNENKRKTSLYGQSSKAGLKRMLIERVVAGGSEAAVDAQ